MAKLPIITFPNPVLSKKTTRIKDVKTPKIKGLILDMLETMEANNGMGLAATQVGESLRVCVLKSDRLDGKTYILVNPEIKSLSWKKTIEEEGCLSFPGQYFPVKRSASVKIQALDRNGKEFEIKADGFFARVLQHEIDHLDGILFTSRKAKFKKSTNHV